MKIGLAIFAAFTFMLNAAALRADGGDTTLIHACVAKDGVIRIVSATTACKNSETALHWVTAARVSAIEAKNESQDSTDASLNSAISAIQTKNSDQDAAIAALQNGTDVASGAQITPPKPPYSFGMVNVSFTNSSTVYDTDGYVGTNQFVIPESGKYLLTMRGFNLEESTFMVLYYSVNGGSPLNICLSIGSIGAYPLCNGSVLLNLNAGDTIGFRSYSTSDNQAGLLFGISRQ